MIIFTGGHCGNFNEKKTREKHSIQVQKSISK